MVRRILDLVRDDLCLRCGTCVGVCPEETFTLGEHGFPVVQGDTCTGCGLCWDVCPGKTENYENLEAALQGERMDPGDVDGFIRSVYLGRSSNPVVTRSATSGGMTTQLLLYALETGLIQAALVVGCHPDRPWQPMPVLARTPEEIQACARSKYCVVPSNVSLKEARQIEGKIACVGLPCHVRGLRLLIERDLFWKDKIAFILGLYCHQPWDAEVILWMLKRNGIEPAEVKSFEYRGGDWPGWIQARKHNGVLVTLHPERTDAIVTYPMLTHAPSRCLLCTDGSNRLADLSLGDGWLCRKAKLEPQHWNTVVVRTSIGESLLEEAREKGAVRLETVHVEDKLGRLASMAREKHAVSLSLMESRRRWGRPVPDPPRQGTVSPGVPMLRLAAFHFIFFMRRFKTFRWLLLDFFLYKMRPFRKPLKEMAKRFSSRPSAPSPGTEPKS